MMNAPLRLLPATSTNSALTTSRPLVANGGPKEPGRAQSCHEQVCDVGGSGGNINTTGSRELNMVMWSSAPNDHSPADAVNVPLCNGQTHRTRSDAPRFHNNPLNVQDITPDCARSNTLTTFDGLTCEDRRIELCRTFHERRFDAMIYSQPDALSDELRWCFSAILRSSSSVTRTLSFLAMARYASLKVSLLDAGTQNTEYSGFSSLV
ncbi:hypothetical protein K456DRAFT_59362, partial [Colletotrichum gloeosporioides 23]